jgi:hypothetical protein
MTDPNNEREELAEKAMDSDPNRESGPSEPGAKTSSGDKDNGNPDENE